MIISELKIYNFRRFKSVDGAPGLQITFHKGLNALIGENDSGKTAVIDALKLVLLTQSNEYIRPVDEDFYKSTTDDACSEFKIDCVITEFTQNEAKNFIEYLKFKKNGDKVEYMLELHYRAWKEGHKIFQELRAGDEDDGILIDGKVRDLLKAVYLKPLRDAEREMSSGRRSRISQILLNHPIFKDKQEHVVLDIFRDANTRIEDYFTNDAEGKRILKTIRENLKSFNDKGQASNAELKTSDIQLKAILESLSLNAPEINPGLGELNLLFIAAELLLLKDDTDGGMKLALIEELEAHLHPQAQLRLISYLQNAGNGHSSLPSLVFGGWRQAHHGHPQCSRQASARFGFLYPGGSGFYGRCVQAFEHAGHYGAGVHGPHAGADAAHAADAGARPHVRADRRWLSEHGNYRCGGRCGGISRGASLWRRQYHGGYRLRFAAGHARCGTGQAQFPVDPRCTGRVERADRADGRIWQPHTDSPQRRAERN